MIESQSQFDPACKASPVEVDDVLEAHAAIGDVSVHSHIAAKYMIGPHQVASG